MTSKLAIASSLKTTQLFSRKGARSSAQQPSARPCTTSQEITPLQAYCCPSCPTRKAWSRQFTDSLNRPFLAVGSPLAECTHMPKENRSLPYFCSVAIDKHRVGCWVFLNKITESWQFCLFPTSPKSYSSKQYIRCSKIHTRGTTVRLTVTGKLEVMATAVSRLLLGDLPAGVQILVV